MHAIRDMSGNIICTAKNILGSVVTTTSLVVNAGTLLGMM